MEYMVLSCFQVDPQSKIEWEEHISGSHKQCENYCLEHSKNSWADWYVYPKGEYPIGYLRSKGIKINQGYVFHC